MAKEYPTFVYFTYSAEKRVSWNRVRLCNKLGMKNIATAFVR